MQTSLFLLYFFSVPCIVSVVATPIPGRNESKVSIFRKIKDGLEVGPVAVVAESGSNVHIVNTFNVFLVRDAISDEVIAQVAAQVAKETKDETPDRKPHFILDEAVDPRPKQIASNSSSAQPSAPPLKNEVSTQPIPPPRSSSSSSTAAPTSRSTAKPTTRAPATTRSSASASASTSRATTRTRRYNPVIVVTRAPAVKSSSTAAPTTRTTAPRVPVADSDSIEPVDQRPNAPNPRRPAAVAPVVPTRGSGPTARPTGDASGEAVDHSVEVQGSQPSPRRANRNRRAQVDSGPEQFVPEHVEHSFED